MLLYKHLKRLCVVVDVDIIPIQTRDPQDDSVRTMSIDAKWRYLVTGADNLLSLKSVGSLQVVALNKFLELI